MKRKFAFAIPFFVLGFVFLGGLAVMLLWNAILPTVLGVAVITYWQAIGILALSRLLFGRFGGGGPWGGRRGGPPHWKNQWVNMTDEEKAKVKEEMIARKEAWRNKFRGEA
jgi:hypothetical protein